MSAITIRNLDESVKARLRVQAARHGRSMEEEARQLLSQGLKDPAGTEPVKLTTLARSLFGKTHGLDLALPVREKSREPPNLPE